MEFGLSDEQIMMRDTFRAFCKRELTPEYVRWLDQNCDFTPDDMLQKLAELGAFGIMIPKAYGGLELGMTEYCIAFEELATASAAVAMCAWLPTGFGARPLIDWGSEAQKQRHLPRIARGEEKWSMAMTEPGGGTDILGAIRTTAVKRGDEYIVNGSKIFITGGHVADFITTIVITDKEPQRKHGLSILFIDAKSPGIEIRLIDKLGIHACGTTEIHFNDVRVPAENLCGEENNGWYQILTTLNPERISTSVFSLGIAKAAFQAALEYAKQREAFGGPIGRFQILQHYLADIAMEIENASNLIYKCAWLCDAKRNFDVEAAMAKVVACRASALSAGHGMEILGGYGFTMEFDLQRHFRDYKQLMFSPISDEMAKNHIAQSFGLPKSY